MTAREMGRMPAAGISVLLKTADHLTCEQLFFGLCVRATLDSPRSAISAISAISACLVAEMREADHSHVEHA